MGLSRRDFLTKAGLAGLAGSTVGLLPDRAIASETGEISDDRMGVLVDLTKCIGCRRCEAACQEANGFEVPTDEELQDVAVFAKHRRPGPRSYTTINRFPRRSDDPVAEPIFVKANCLHCNEPACVSACLVGAFQKLDNSAVVYDAWKCMGCRYCMVACPFQIPTYEYDNVLTPQVRKCTLCCNEGNPYKGGVPACVQTCPKEAMTYGKRNEVLARAHEQVRRYPDVYNGHIYGEHEAGGTSWAYLGPKGYPFEELGFIGLGSSPPPMRTERIQHGIFKYFIPPLAWYGLLGAVMWVSRPDADGERRMPT
ncbi:MAG: 4Fe-4S dicluster domain-containing protein [Gemmatimonadota bacterium]|nr:MAG: 4Fe-4S dicluster domain-containing protein [Gemmatimonadota bacterium]